MGFTTRKSILLRVCSGDEISWEQFYETYRPLVWLRGGDFDLTFSEREELLQQVMLAFFKQSKRFVYSPKKGRFRDYMRTIISHQALRIKKQRNKEHLLIEDKSMNDVPDDNLVIDDAWDIEWKSLVLSQALLELRQRLGNITYQAFDMYALQGGAPSQVAEFLDISVNNVYVAKNRAIKQLQKIIKEIDLVGE